MISLNATKRIAGNSIDTRATLQELLATDLNFHDEDSSEMSHDFHAFPAKFPPQLPRLFIAQLTDPGDRVLDPMMGSGTCVVEALISGRQGIGSDIDPLAVMLSKVKVNRINPVMALSVGLGIADRAENALNNSSVPLAAKLDQRFDHKTRQFVDYWFGNQTQLELMALVGEIEAVNDPEIRAFLLLIFSAIIITKSGGVSSAWDLAHTRPHKLKQGLSKSYKPAIKEFRRRLHKNVSGLQALTTDALTAHVHFGNAEKLPLRNNSIDLIVTSPPYASNAIDYMRAHKFSLVWFGFPLDSLSDLRARYIGGEKVTDYRFLEMPSQTHQIIEKISQADKKKGLALLRYYSEMRNVLSETVRVLKPGKAAVLVVGSSLMRGIGSQTQDCVGEIGSSLGLELVGIGTRRLDRDRRMLPARLKKRDDSQIEVRMHEEYVIGFMKPLKES